MAISSSSLSSKLSPTILNILLRRLPTATSSLSAAAADNKPLFDLNPKSSSSSSDVLRRRSFIAGDYSFLGRFDRPVVEVEKMKVVGGGGDRCEFRGEIVVDDDDDWIKDYSSSDEFHHVDSDDNDDDDDDDDGSGNDFDDDDDVIDDEDEVKTLEKRRN